MTIGAVWDTRFWASTTYNGVFQGDLTNEEFEHIFQFVVNNEDRINTTVNFVIGIGFDMTQRDEFEFALPGVNYYNVLYRLRSLSDLEIDTLFRVINLPRHIERVQNEIPMFSMYSLDVKTSLVDAAVGKTLTDDVKHLINDPNSSWTKVAVVYLDNENVWNSEHLGTVATEKRMRTNCKVFFSYGQSYNPSISEYNPCSKEYEIFYPYGPEIGDETNPINDDGSSGEQFISIPFPFFETFHDSLWINTNGIISFIMGIEEYTPHPFPLGDTWRVVAPFWADVDTRNGGNVFWRQTTDERLLARATRDVITNTIDQPHFKSIWMLVATWDDVSFYGGYESQSRNTFQAVLITNGRHSFTLFNYGNITWTTGTASDGDTNGLGGTPAKVGFNAGDNSTYFTVPTSFTHEIVNIETTTNVGVTGRYVFRVDERNVRGVGCNTEGSLTIYPTTGSMLGGDHVIVSGVCFNDSFVSSKILCKFGSSYTEGTKESQTQVSCITPIFYEIGRINFQVSIDDGTTYPYTGIFNIVNIERKVSLVTRTNMAAWLDHSVNMVELQWDSSLLPSSRYVDIKLYGYMEDHHSGEFGWIDTGAVLSGYDNGGQLAFEKSEFNPSPLYSIGALRISGHDEENTDATNFHALWSDVHELAWVHGIDAGDWCYNWHKSDENVSPSLKDTVPCPCTLQQAFADIGRYSPHPRCSTRSVTDDNCVDMPGAVHCIRANVPSDDGSGRACCYEADGTILNSGDAFGSGAYHLRHHEGVAPYIEVGKVPYLSHFLEDLLPWRYCCLHTDFDDVKCGKFFARRPSHDCSGYEAPRPATWFGDPHLKTLDGLSYTFNGYGEFTLIDINNRGFTLQGRMAPLADNSDATVFTAMAMQTNMSDTVHIARERRFLDAYVRIKGHQTWEIVNFEDNHWWDFNGKALSAVILAPSTFKNRTVGLLGTWNDNTGDDLLASNGVYVSVNSSLQQIHHDFGLTWRISAEESLFRYKISETHSSLTDITYQPMFGIIESDITDDVIAICGDNRECIFDLQITNDTETALGSLEASHIYEAVINGTMQVTTCGYLETPTYGIKTGSSYITGSVITFHCLPGFTLSGSATSQCLDDGTWDNYTTACNIVECGEVMAPSHGNVNGDMFTYGEIVTFSCDVGYIINGVTEIECLASGQWNDSTPSCEIIDCGVVNAPTHGHVSDELFTYGEILRFSCEKGFTLNGTAEIECFASGQWSDISPVCEIVECGGVIAPFQGNVRGKVFTYGEVLRFSCDEGYTLNGAVEIKCLASGEWSDVSPECEVTDCGVVIAPSHGNVNGELFTYGEILQFSCDEGYTMNGVAEIKCLASGLWSDVSPSCEKTMNQENKSLVMIVAVSSAVIVVVVIVLCVVWICITCSIKPRNHRHGSEKPPNQKRTPNRTYINEDVAHSPYVVDHVMFGKYIKEAETHKMSPPDTLLVKTENDENMYGMDNHGRTTYNPVYAEGGYD
uniref:Protein mesh-like n=1 Tax=Saccoglossus kowalevskii TaxID=10224 RepID=A0ABM0M9L1_SACKO